MRTSRLKANENPNNLLINMPPVRYLVCRECFAMSNERCKHVYMVRACLCAAAMNGLDISTNISSLLLSTYSDAAHHQAQDTATSTNYILDRVSSDVRTGDSYSFLTSPSTCFHFS